MSTSASRQARATAVGVLFLAVLLGAVVRLVYLKVRYGTELEHYALRQRLSSVQAPRERGPIVDRQGRILAATVEGAQVYLRPALFPIEHSEQVARVLEIPVETVRQKAQAPAPFVWLKRDATMEQARALQDLGVTGVGFERTRLRVYPRKALAGQVLGSTGVDLQPLGGVEASYDQYLRGRVPTWRVERDAHGQILPDQVERGDSDLYGARVELTIDADFQRAAETALAEAVSATRALQGLAIVLDPHSGEILALAHNPPFDPSEREEARNERARLRAITDPFEPGSTLKSFIAAVGLEAGVVGINERLYCEGGRYRVGNRVVRDHDPYGWLSFPDVLRHSSNICTAKIGERLGSERVHAALVSFGFGRRTGVDLPGEHAYPLRPWQRWARIHLVTTSFGQGVAVTPMQLVTAYAALANGGRLLRPYIVRRVVAADGRVLLENRPQQVAQPISPETAGAIGEILAGVVEDGTGTRARLQGIRVAGKTGTAQKVEVGSGRYSPRDRIASFVGYFPVQDPRFVILVIVDTPRTATYGGLVAAPVFRQIGEFVADRVGLRTAVAPFSVPSSELTRSHPSLQLASWAGEGGLNGMPSFLGLSLREAVLQAQRAGWAVEVEGTGYVVWQDPPPGALRAPGKRLRLRLAPPGS